MLQHDGNFLTKTLKNAGAAALTGISQEEKNRLD